MDESMKFENKNEKVASVPRFIKRVFIYISLTLILLTLSIAIGIFGYHYLADIGWLDSFHMTAMILTGMGPVVEMKSNGAKLFSSFYALYSGVAFLSITAIFFAPLVHRILHILHVDER
jgi:hypothetical protein